MNQPFGKTDHECEPDDANKLEVGASHATRKTADLSDFTTVVEDKDDNEDYDYEDEPGEDPIEYEEPDETEEEPDEEAQSVEDI